MLVGPISPEVAFVPKPRLIVHSVDCNAESGAMHQCLQNQPVGLARFTATAAVQTWLHDVPSTKTHRTLTPAADAVITSDQDAVGQMQGTALQSSATTAQSAK